MSTARTTTAVTARKAPATKRVKSAPAKRTKAAPAKSTKAASAKRATAAPTKDPKGGLTAAGRKAFAEKDGAHLKPGVKKAESEMTPMEMKRKGSWAVRFYGREGDLPPLRNTKGEPTRFALTAAAWGEPVPKTEAAARRIAARGRQLLERYRRLRDAK